MHPAYKLQYFKKLKWEESSVLAASMIVRDCWNASYRFSDIGQEVLDLSTVSKIPPCLSTLINI